MPNDLINHIVLMADSSASMTHLSKEVVEVVDNETGHLAQRSKELDQETRGTVYTFNTSVTCHFYDKDVLRLPSLKDRYRAQGNTALLDATLKGIRDLEQTATLYGDHAFLMYVLTDGEENSSAYGAQNDLQRKLRALPDNWTVGVLVPNQNGVFEAKRFGFPAANIAVWDPSKKGIEEVGRTIRAATDNFMRGRSEGKRSSRNIFQLDTTDLNPFTVAQTLTGLSPNSYWMIPVQTTEIIQPYVESRLGQSYRIGSAYYQLSKSETVQGGKQICIRDKRTGGVYTGHQARALLGLPAHELRVKPSDHPDYDIFVQSTSVNRKLVPGTDLLVLR